MNVIDPEVPGCQARQDFPAHPAISRLLWAAMAVHINKHDPTYRLRVLLSLPTPDGLGVHAVGEFSLTTAGIDLKTGRDASPFVSFNRITGTHDRKVQEYRVGALCWRAAIAMARIAKLGWVDRALHCPAENVYRLVDVNPAGSRIAIYDDLDDLANICRDREEVDACLVRLAKRGRRVSFAVCIKH